MRLHSFENGLAAALVGIAALLAPWPLSAANENDAERGYPAMRRVEIAAKGFNWREARSIFRDNRGLFWLSANGAAALYDSVRTEIVPLKNIQSPVTLEMASDGTIYAAILEDFGEIAYDDRGAPYFQTLSALAPEGMRANLGEIKIYPTSKGVFFKSKQTLYRLNDSQTVDAWTFAGELTCVFERPEGVYVAEGKRGLIRIEEDQLVPVVGAASLQSAKGIVEALPMGDGGTLCITRSDGLRKFDGKSVRSFKSDLNEELRATIVYDSLKLGEGRYAIGTHHFGVLICSEDGRELDRYDKAKGLPENRVKLLYHSPDGALWVVQDAGATQILINSPISYFDDRHGLTGSIYSLVRHRGLLYMVVRDGLARLTADGSIAFSNLLSTEDMGSAGSGEALNVPEGLLIGMSDSVMLKMPDRTELLHTFQGNVNAIAKCTVAPGVYYILMDRQVSLATLSGGEFKVRENISLPGGWGSKIIESEPGVAWIEAGYGRLYQLDVTSVELQEYRLDSFGKKDGLPENDWVYVHKLKGQVFFSSKHGLLRYDKESGKLAPPDQRLDRIFQGGGKNVETVGADEDDNVWISQNGENAIARAQANGAYVWDDLTLANMKGESISEFLFDRHGVVWMALREGGLARYDPSVEQPQTRPFRTLIRSVRLLDGGEVYFAGNKESFSLSSTLPYNQNDLRFSYAAMTYREPTATQYRYKLETYMDDWSEWSHEAHKEFTNLSPGSYRFRVQSRNLYGRLGEEDEFTFSIQPPFYMTLWAYIMYFALGVAMIAGYSHLRSQSLRRRNMELQAVVDERTREVTAQSEELSAQNEELSAQSEELMAQSEQLHMQNKALGEANAELERLNVYKNEFIGIASHDLKNPLGAITYLSELLGSEWQSLDKGAVNEYLKDINDSASLMTDIIANLLDINRIEQGRLVVETTRCNFYEIIEEAVEKYRDPAKRKKQSILFQPETSSANVMGDHSLLVQVMDNLVSNAVKYTPEGKRIWARVKREDDKVRVEVQDEGPGIKEEDMKKLFQEFSRLSSRPTGGESSTGLGLAIVKRMVEAMEGKVWCESVYGKGSTFIIELPRA